MAFLSGLVLGALFGLAFIVAFVYFENKRSRQRLQLAVFIAGLSRLSLDDIRRMFPKQLFPPWIMFTTLQKVNWLNRELKEVWPYVNEATSLVLKTLLEPILEKYKPSGFTSLRFKKFTLGTVPLQLTGVEMVEAGTGEIVMEIELKWDGNPSIILGLQTMLGVSLQVQVKDAGFTGLFRLIFKPLVDGLPGFGAVTFTLVDIKKLDYKLKVIGGDVNSVPGLNSKVEDMIRNAVEDSLVWPNRKVIPILPGDYRNLELQVTGILEVRLVQGRQLRNKDMIGKSDPFASVYIRPIPSRMEKTKTINNDLNPIWNEHFKLDVEDVATQKLTIKVFDDEGIQEAQLIGCAQLELKTLEAGKLTDLWLPLVKDLNRPHEENSSTYRGEVHVELIYHPLDEDIDNIDASLMNPSNPSMHLTSLEKVITTNMNGPTQALPPFKSRIPNKFKEGAVIRGILSVTVIRGENLTAVDFNNSSDPYVILKMKKSDAKKKTKMIPNSLAPEWNQTFNIMVEDALHDMVLLEVMDHDIFLEKSMGKCALTLTRVLREGDYDVEVQLDGVKTGTLFLHLKWTQPIPPDPQYV